ncbi:MAG: hypothetical protein OEO77_11930 [Acidimicrobiia bacterium]|nr:hypothetical protein [Acidimicrobiia bacterium]
MGKQPATVLTMLVLLALGSVGLAYGLWFKTLAIEGTVETGNVDAEWSFVGCFDIEDKDVGTIDGFIDSVDPASLHFEIGNGYPSYTADCEVEYTYTGSVPAHVEAIHFVPGDFTGCAVNQSPTVGSFVASCDQATVTWANGLCSQLHENDFLGSSLRVHVEQGAEQNAVYGFGVEVQLNQFNESACP